MPEYRKYILELGTGVDLHGGDETKAAMRAVKDAISHASMIGLGSLLGFKSLQELDEALMVDVTVAAPNPEKVEGEKVLGVLPEGRRRIRVVEGGLRWPTPGTPEEARSHEVVVVNAAIVVLVDVEKIPTRQGSEG